MESSYQGDWQETQIEIYENTKESKNRVFWGKKSVIARNHRKAQNLEKGTLFTAKVRAIQSKVLP